MRSSSFAASDALRVYILQLEHATWAEIGIGTTATSVEQYHRNTVYRNFVLAKDNMTAVYQIRPCPWIDAKCLSPILECPHTDFISDGRSQECSFRFQRWPLALRHSEYAHRTVATRSRRGPSKAPLDVSLTLEALESASAAVLPFAYQPKKLETDRSS